MAYKALYRQYRPDSFHGVYGQPAIVRTLRQQVASGRIAHAYLFCGPRGTGKTTCAKIFARAINCTLPQQGEPCGQCETCLGIRNETVMDILEIDAASNNGVDEIRDLRDKVRFPPTLGRYKVYIIDEVHMLSIGAFNALLKTLEEPPAHAVFILCTTEGHKLPATIISRCQRFDFRRIEPDTIVACLEDILQSLGRRVEPEGLTAIARAAQGAMRDAISLLDQCLSSEEGDIDAAQVDQALGTGDPSFYFCMAEHILRGEMPSALADIAQAVKAGRDYALLARELAYHFRCLLLCCHGAQEALGVTHAAQERYAGQAKGASPARILRAMEAFLTAEAEMKWASQPRIQLELAAARACMPQAEQSLDALTDRMDQLQAKLEALSAGGIAPPAATITRTTNTIQAIDCTVPAKAGVDAADGDAGQQWKGLLSRIKKEKIAVYAMLAKAQFKQASGGSITLVFPPEYEMNIQALSSADKQAYINQTASEVFLQPMKVKMEVAASRAAESDLVGQMNALFGAEHVEVID